MTHTENYDAKECFGLTSYIYVSRTLLKHPLHICTVIFYVQYAFLLYGIGAFLLFIKVHVLTRV